MKKIFILLMSAFALIVVLAMVVFAWQAQTQTYWSGSAWVSTYSSLVTATSTPGYVIADAQSSSQFCNYRTAYACYSDGGFIQSAQCPRGTPTPSCCEKVQWNPSVGTQYKAYAFQTAGTDQSCGPTIATIQSSSTYYCRSAP